MIVKVCGMREARNIGQVEQSGADWMGFIFYGRSPRFVASCPDYLPQTMKRVGVFVNADLNDILAHVGEFGLDAVQLHGAETPEMCCELRNSGLTVIKAFALRSEADVEGVETYEGACNYFLFDTPTSGFGGSGRKFDWTLLDAYHGMTPFLLSGGLSADSLEALSQFSHPRWAGIDLNSGFETAPAVKDASALKQFINEFKKLSI